MSTFDEEQAELEAYNLAQAEREAYDEAYAEHCRIEMAAQEIKAAHNAWIDAYLERRRGKVLGECRAAALEMQEAFPELLMCRGHVETPWGRRAHWWLKTAGGQVVDPTASQFPYVFSYHELQLGDDIRVGTCMNCGEPIWRTVKSLDKAPDPECMCSDECGVEFNAHLNPVCE